MTLGTGIDGSLGYVFETTYGTAVTVDKWNDFNGESLKLDQKWTDPKGLAAGRTVPLIARVAQTTRSVSGGVDMDFSVKSMGRLVKLMLSSSITTPTIISGAAYSQVHQLNTAASPLSMTWQVGRSERSATVRPFTASGVKCAGWEIGSSEGSLVTLHQDVMAQDMVTGTALATPSYVTGNEIFNHTQLVAKIGGTASTTSGVVSVAGGAVVTSTLKGVSVKGTNPLSESYGNSATMKQPLLNGMVDASIEFDAEFTSRTELYDVWRAGTVVPVQLTWTGSTISGGSYTLDIIASATKITADDVNVSGPDILPEKPVFKIGHNGTDSALQITITSTDTTL